MLYDPKWEVSAPVKVEAWQQALIDAIAVLEKHGWCQKKLFDAKGRHCMVGALDKAARDKNDFTGYGTALDKLEQVVGGHVPVWNDRFYRTEKQVLAKMREALNAV